MAVDATVAGDDVQPRSPLSSLPPMPARNEWVGPGIVLLVLCVVEYLTAAVDPRIGLVGHALLLGGLVTVGARTNDSARRELYWTLCMAPVIRIASLSLPIGALPLVSWYPYIGVPIFAAAFMTMRQLGYTPAQVGLTVRLDDLPRQLALVPVGVVLGVGEYLIFRPAPLAERFTLADIWLPSLVLLIFTGLEEELIFRGIMQRAALRSLGRWGLVFISLIFSSLHIGYLSVLDLIFVGIVGQMWALFALRTRSLLGVTISHGMVNTTLFLVMPFVAPVFLGSGAGDLLTLPLPAAPPPAP